MPSLSQLQPAARAAQITIAAQCLTAFERTTRLTASHSGAKTCGVVRALLLPCCLSILVACSSDPPSEDRPGDGGAVDSGKDATTESALDGEADAAVRPLRLMTWNLQTFPLSTSTANLVAAVIEKELPDVVAVQEVSDAAAFRALPEVLPAGYAAEVANDTATLTLGLLYRKDRVSVGAPEQLFTDDSYAFPRPPFKVKVIAGGVGDGSFDFVLVNVHLKAQLDAESVARRKAACVALDAWIEDQQAASSETDFVMLGDFNDELTDAPAYNVFEPFLNDPASYRFLTLEAAQAGEHTYLPFQSMIDHVLVTADVLPEYGAGTTDVMELEQSVSGYQSNVSDHRPVIVELGAP